MAAATGGFGTKQIMNALKSEGVNRQHRERIRAAVTDLEVGKSRRFRDTNLGSKPVVVTRRSSRFDVVVLDK